METKKIILMLIFVFGLVLNLTPNRNFTGEVYKINRYANQVICRGIDLTVIKVGQILYICDAQNKLKAKVKIKKYYTTLIETTPIWGNIKRLKLGMSVYSSAKQFTKKPIKKIKYKKEYDFYWWDVEVIYEVGGKEYKRKIRMRMPKVIEVLAKGWAEPAKISADEIKYLGVRDMWFTSITLKDGIKVELEQINISFPMDKIPEEGWSEKINVNRLIKQKKKIRISKEDVVGIKPIRAKYWIEKSKVQEKEIGGIKFIFIKGGTFWMGSPEGEGYDREHPRHRVRVSSYWIGKYEVTQKQYEAIMGENPSAFKGDNRPVENVSWNDAIEFCKKFNGRYEVKARLPYEAEWEYACRAGTTIKYYWGEEMDGSYCWYWGNSGYETHPVGQKKPNRWGLYDIIGNVWEWCMDWYDSGYYSSSPINNPRGPANSGSKVLRGGSWVYNIFNCCSASRFNLNPDGRYYGAGFRLVVSQ